METFCSLLIGGKGNAGYSWVGRLMCLSEAQGQENGTDQNLARKNSLAGIRMGRNELRINQNSI